MDAKVGHIGVKRGSIMIIEHNLGVLSRIVLNLFVVAEARVVLGPNIEACCSYEIVLLKKRVIVFDNDGSSVAL